MFDFPVRLETDSATQAVMVYFQDLPNVFSAGATREEALQNAVMALETFLEGCMRDRTRFPLPTMPTTNTPVVHLSAIASIKAAIHNELLAQDLYRADLARMMGLHGPQVFRMLDLRRSTRLETLEAALNVLGKRLVVSVV